MRRGWAAFQQLSVCPRFCRCVCCRVMKTSVLSDINAFSLWWQFASAHTTSFETQIERCLGLEPSNLAPRAFDIS